MKKRRPRCGRYWPLTAHTALDSQAVVESRHGGPPLPSAYHAAGVVQADIRQQV
ncbi:MAG: hypothetical protein IAG10_05375 [Planctomycetaceae bacterium]|nr:hypothetical protein [Planctomycetaceae bacterium]